MQDIDKAATPTRDLLKEAAQEFYERTGIRIVGCRFRWAVGAGCADVLEVSMDTEQP